MRTTRWIFRRSVGVGTEPVEVSVDEETWAWYEAMARRVLALEAGAERSGLIREIHFVMEAALLLDARMTAGAASAPQTASERPAPEPVVEQTSLLPPPTGSEAFPIPLKAREKLARRAGYYERDNGPVQSTLDQPGDLGPERLPDPPSSEVAKQEEAPDSGERPQLEVVERADDEPEEERLVAPF